MIRAEIFRDRQGAYRGFSVSGHARFDDYGRDVVCAAVSVLTQNTVNSIERFTEDRFSGEIDERTGAMRVDFPDIPGKASTLLLDSMVSGLQDIEKEYGSRYLHIRFREV